MSIQVPEREFLDEDGQYRVHRQRISGAFYLPVFRLEEDTRAWPGFTGYRRSWNIRDNGS